MVSSSASPLDLLPWKTNPSHPNNIYLIALSHLADDFSRGWVDGREGFLADCIVPFVIYENLQGKSQAGLSLRARSQGDQGELWFFDGI